MAAPRSASRALMRASVDEAATTGSDVTVMVPPACACRTHTQPAAFFLAGSALPEWAGHPGRSAGIVALIGDCEAPGGKAMRDLLAALLCGALWAYWSGALVKAIVLRLRHGRAAGLFWPRQPVEQAMWPIWVPVVVAWNVLP